MFEPINEKIYLLGRSVWAFPVYNDLRVFDPKENGWEEVFHSALNSDDHWPYPVFSGKGASCVIDQHLYIWEGQRKIGHVADVCRFDSSTKEWVQIKSQTG